MCLMIDTNLFLGVLWRRAWRILRCRGKRMRPCSKMTNRANRNTWQKRTPRGLRPEAFSLFHCVQPDLLPHTGRKAVSTTNTLMLPCNQSSCKHPFPFGIQIHSSSPSIDRTYMIWRPRNISLQIDIAQGIRISQIFCKHAIPIHNNRPISVSITHIRYHGIRICLGQHGCSIVRISFDFPLGRCIIFRARHGPPIITYTNIIYLESSHSQTILSCNASVHNLSVAISAQFALRHVPTNSIYEVPSFS